MKICAIWLVLQHFHSADHFQFSGLTEQTNDIEKKIESEGHSVMSYSLQLHGLQPARLLLELSRQEYWSGLPFCSPEDLPDTGIEPRSPALQADSLPSESPRKPTNGII